METRKSINSSGAVFGEVVIQDDQIIIRHNTKPELTITDPDVITEVFNKTDEGIRILYDKYELMIGEIAALYGVAYSNINRIRMPKIQITSGKNTGRRNARFGATVSVETRQKIGEKSKGRKGCGQYERTSEIREKTSTSLKEYYKTHEVSEETRKKLSQAWVDGRYANSPMGTGIHGYFTSIKMHKTFYFRSLLELYYMITLEESQDIYTFDVEPFQIAIDNVHHYTPDFLVNNQHIKELKTSKHLTYTKEDDRFNQEVESGYKYAQEHHMTFEVLYDTDLNYDTRQFKRWLMAHPETIELYHITFDRDISKWS